MNPQERAELENFLDQLVQIRGVEKIAEADGMIRRAVDRQPDAAYLLVQRAMLLGRALKQAKAQIAELEQAQQEPSREFLGSSASSSWSASAPAGPSAMAAPARPPTGASPSFQPAAPTGWPVAGPGGGSSFLGQAAATAAGVAGGAFLFEGIESLFGHHGSQPMGYEPAPEDVTINNYYVNEDHPDETGESRFARDEPEDRSDVDADFVPDDDDLV